jgi:hypothetical protein
MTLIVVVLATQLGVILRGSQPLSNSDLNAFLTVIRRRYWSSSAANGIGTILK